MNQDILLSKIVPNATDTTWTQAYTTLNVYITLSIEKESGKGSVTLYGKELLEKLQREFFAVDNKSLENIKKAVGNVSQNIDEGYSYSIIVGAIVGDILYIVIASSGQAILKRQGKVGVIATGIENELHGFSGKIQHDDIVVFETGDFAKKIPIEKISEYLSSADVSQIAENITPLVHENSKGTEGAIILQFKDLSKIGQSQQSDILLEKTDEQTDAKEENYEQNIAEKVWQTASINENRNIEELEDDQEEEYLKTQESRSFFPFVTIPSVSFTNKKVILAAVVVLLIIILGGSIFYQVYKKGQAQKESEFQKVFAPIQSKFDEGTNLENLNKTLAFEDFTAASKMVENAISKYPKGSFEYKKLMDFKQKLENKISKDGGENSAKNVKEFLKPGDKLKSITAITHKGGTLLVLDGSGKQVATITTDGKVKKIFEIDDDASYISADEKFIYVMGRGVTSIDRGNGNTQMIIKSIKGDAFDIFGSNIYTLTNNDILKYKSPSYESASYFTEKPNLKSNIQDISISGPIWILETNGNIERFTKGKNDNISITGLAGPIAAGAKIYADQNNDNVYVMDVKNQRVVSFNEKGEYQTQYEGSFIKEGTSFAINESDKKGFVLSKGIVYSFDL